METYSYFDAMGKAKKAYTGYLEPVCKAWTLTQNELTILLFLHNNPQLDRAADIVACRGIAKSHVSLSVSDLESRELLTRRFESSDRRAAHLTLTEQGQAVAEEGRQRQRLFFDALYANFSSEEMDILRSLTRRVMENIDKF